MSIQQTVDIPVNHRLTIELPREVPAGKATIIYNPAPLPDQDTPADRTKYPTTWSSFIRKR